MLQLLAISFGISLLSPALHRLLGRLTPFVLTAGVATLAGWFAWHLPDVASGRPRLEVMEWFPALGIRLALRLDGLSLLFALLITGIGAFIVLYAGGYLAGHPQLGRFYACLLAFMGSMLGVVLSDDLILLFVFWELTSLTSYLLIGFNHEARQARTAALQALLVTGAGGLAMLAGFVLLGFAGGHYQISGLLSQAGGLQSHPLLIPALWLLLIGAFTKSAQAPFHFWLPSAMAAPTPVSAYLHSSTMVKAGIYLLARVHPLFSETTTWSIVLPVVGGITMVAAAAQALMQTDLKKLLAYSTISVLGMLTFLLGLGSPEAGLAAMGLILAHALYKAPLFLATGSIDHETGTRDLRGLGGLGRLMPLTCLAVLLAALSNAGLPPFLGFIAKELGYEAGLHDSWAALVTAALVLANMFLVACAIVMAVDPFWGPRPRAAMPSTGETPVPHPHTGGTPVPHHHTDAGPHHEGPTGELHEAPATMWLPPLLLAAGGLALGLFPHGAAALVGPAVTATLGRVHDVDLGLWHGLNLPLLAGGFTLAGGAALFLQRRRARALPGRLRRLEVLTPSGLYARGLDGLMRLAVAQTRLLQSGYLRIYLGTILLTALVLVGASWGGLDLPIGAMETPPRLHDGAVAVLLVGAVVMALLSASRLAAVAALGVIGYSVAIFFVLLGGPDLAMTQFAIETLAVILLIFVLYRLPRFVTFAGLTQRLGELFLAAAVGAMMAMLLLAATADAGRDDLRRYFTDNSLPLANGRNIVNVILVDFRGFDTLGEITVLAVAAIGVRALLRLRPGDGKP